MYSEAFRDGSELGTDDIPITVEIDGEVKKRYDVLVAGIFNQNLGPMPLVDARALLLDGYFQAFDLYRGINPLDPLKFVAVKQQHVSLKKILYKQSLNEYRINGVSKFGYTFPEYMEVTMEEKSAILDLAITLKDAVNEEVDDLQDLLDE